MRNDELEKVIGGRIRSLRIGESLTQAEVAETANVSLGALKHLESGAGATVRTLVKVLRALGQRGLARHPGTRDSLVQSARPPHRSRTGGPSCSAAACHAPKGGRSMTYQPTDVIEVLAWGRRVGAVALDPDTGWYAFAYTKEWIDRGVELAPLHMALRARALRVPPAAARDLLRSTATSRRLTARQIRQCSRRLLDGGARRRNGDITPLDRLAYAAERAMGALEFRPPARSEPASLRLPSNWLTWCWRHGSPCAASSPATRPPMPPSSN